MMNTCEFPTFVHFFRVCVDVFIFFIVLRLGVMFATDLLVVFRLVIFKGVVMSVVLSNEGGQGFPNYHLTTIAALSRVN